MDVSSDLSDNDLRRIFCDLGLPDGFGPAIALAANGVSGGKRERH